MARDRGFRAVGICAPGFASVDTTIGIGEQHLAVLIDRRVVKVEQVATRIVPAFIPDAGFALHWAARSVDERPGLPAVVGVCDIAVPSAFEVRVFVIAASGRAEEGHRRAIGIAGDR